MYRKHMKHIILALAACFLLGLGGSVSYGKACRIRFFSGRNADRAGDTDRNTDRNTDSGTDRSAAAIRAIYEK